MISYNRLKEIDLKSRKYYILTALSIMILILKINDFNGNKRKVDKNHILKIFSFTALFMKHQIV